MPCTKFWRTSSSNCCGVFGGDIVLALALAELDYRNAVRCDESIDLLQEGVGHDAHQRRRGHGLLAMETEEASGSFFHLQFRLIDVQVHAINAFDFQGHMILEDVRKAARYTHGWLRSTTVYKTTTAWCGSILEAAKADLADRPESFLLIETTTRLVGLRRSLVSALSQLRIRVQSFRGTGLLTRPLLSRTGQETRSTIRKISCDKALGLFLGHRHWRGHDGGRRGFRFFFHRFLRGCQLHGRRDGLNRELRPRLSRGCVSA